MSIKKDLLAEINKKAQKIRDKRVDAANNKSIEAAVFDFFRNIEESRKVHNNTKYDPFLFENAKRSLEERVRGYDQRSNISVEFNAPQDPTDWSEQMVRGVTIWWSKYYINKNNVEPSLYIDVSQTLLF